jgi:hypothetical protein
MSPMFSRFQLPFWLMILLAAVSFAQPQAPDTVWTRIYEIPGVSLTAYSGVETADGGFMLAGSATVGLPETRYGFLMRLDEDGDSLWTRYYTYGINGYYFYAITAAQGEDMSWRGSWPMTRMNTLPPL